MIRMTLQRDSKQQHHLKYIEDIQCCFVEYQIYFTRKAEFCGIFTSAQQKTFSTYPLCLKFQFDIVQVRCFPPLGSLFIFLPAVGLHCVTPDRTHGECCFYLSRSVSILFLFFVKFVIIKINYCKRFLRFQGHGYCFKGV